MGTKRLRRALTTEHELGELALARAAPLVAAYIGQLAGMAAGELPVYGSSDPVWREFYACLRHDLARATRAR